MENLAGQLELRGRPGEPESDQGIEMNNESKRYKKRTPQFKSDYCVLLLLTYPPCPQQ